MEGRVFDPGQVLSLVQQRSVMIDADESVGHECGGRVGIVMDFNLVPGTFEGEDHTLVTAFGVLLRDCDQRQEED
jgi:hypothetical protein